MSYQNDGKYLFFFKDFDTYWMVVRVLVPEGSTAGEVIDWEKCDTHEEAVAWAQYHGCLPEPVWYSPEYESRGEL